MSKFAALELNVTKPGRMIILHPVSRQPLRIVTEGEDLGKEAYLDLYSDDSPQAKRHQRNLLRNRLNMRGRGKLTPEQLESENLEQLVGQTAAWLLVDFDGKVIDVPYSPENARELFASDSMAWLREQADEFRADRGNLSTASSAS